jgi:hypothetical protein
MIGIKNNAFGMVMPERCFSNDKYRWGFNGQEHDRELNPSITTAEFWEYDGRLGRRWNLDPKPNIALSGYSVLENNPIVKLDVEGDTVSFNFLKQDKSAMLKKADPDIIQAQEKDGVFVVFAHGSPRHISVIVGDKKFRVTNGKDFLAALSSDDDFRTAIENKEKIHLIIYACNTASNIHYDQHFGNGLIKTEKTISQDISEELSSINKQSEVLAIDGYGIFGEVGGKTKFLGVEQSLTREVKNNMEGGFVRLKDGNKITKTKFSFNGTTKPKEGDETKIK